MSRLRAGLALAVISVLLGLWLVPAQALSQTSNVVARDSHGHVLPADPLLRAGDRIQLTVTGFGPGAPVMVRLGATPIGTYVADSHGIVTFSYVIPVGSGKGSYVIVAVGTPPLRGITPTPVHGSDTSDPQIVQGLVPTLGLFTFRLNPGATSPPPTSPHPSSSVAGGGSGTSGGTGGLGHTGVNVIGLLIAAGIGLLGGLLILIPGRRRKHA